MFPCEVLGKQPMRHPHAFWPHEHLHSSHLFLRDIETGGYVCACTGEVPCGIATELLALGRTMLARKGAGLVLVVAATLRHVRYNLLQ